MNKNTKLVVLTALGVLVFEVVALVFVSYSGIPDVAATKPEGKFMRWFLNTTKDHSLSARARSLRVPSFNDSATIVKGFDHYNEMCVTCHGGPGRKPDELAQGLNPSPPNLAFSTRDMHPAQIFLVVKDGIAMTGMPGFGTTHNDSAIWSMVAFINRLQTMTPEEYQRFQNSRNQN